MKQPSYKVVHFLSFLFLITVLFSACRKKETGEVDTPPEDTQLSDADSLKYLVYRIMQKTFVEDGRDKNTQFPIYYWYKNVPELDPLSGAYPNASDLVNKMRGYTLDNKGRTMDRYSGLDDGTLVGEIEGVAGDIGMEVRYAWVNETDALPVVIAVDKNSPAGRENVRRGWVITSVNGQPTKYDGQNGPNLNRVVNAIYFDATATFEFRTSGGAATTKTLAKAEYALNPVLFDTVYSVSGKNVGYFVLHSFPKITDRDGGPSVTKKEIDRVFNSFAGKNISSLIVDLRYNPGGESVATEYIANKIAPASARGKLMYKNVYNDLFGGLLQAEGISNSVMFGNGGALNLEKVLFIASESTASASELLYNVLRPYMNVKLIGDTTRGKPVGSAVIPISIFKNKEEKFLAYLLPIVMEAKNAAGEGGYYFGIAPDVTAPDYVDLPWGDTEDANLKKAFQFISNGSFGRSMPPHQLIDAPDRRISTRQQMPALRPSGQFTFDVPLTTHK